MSSQSETEYDEPAMQRRRTTMPDGRYLIYYSFDDGSDRSPASDDAESTEAEDV